MPFAFRTHLGMLLLNLLAVPVLGQSGSRVLDHNAIGWFTYNGDHAVGPH